MVKEDRILEKIDKNTHIKYFRMKMPMMSDRDNVLKIHTRALDEKSDFVHLQTVEHPDFPEVPHAVRMFLFLRAKVS